jgi:hypothetical protein
MWFSQLPKHGNDRLSGISRILTTGAHALPPEQLMIARVGR